MQQVRLANKHECGLKALTSATGHAAEWNISCAFVSMATCTFQLFCFSSQEGQLLVVPSFNEGSFSSHSNDWWGGALIGSCILLSTWWCTTFAFVKARCQFSFYYRLPLQISCYSMLKKKQSWGTSLSRQLYSSKFIQLNLNITKYSTFYNFLSIEHPCILNLDITKWAYAWFHYNKISLPRWRNMETSADADGHMIELQAAACERISHITCCPTKSNHRSGSSIMLHVKSKCDIVSCPPLYMLWVWVKACEGEPKRMVA